MDHPQFCYIQRLMTKFLSQIIPISVITALLMARVVTGTNKYHNDKYALSLLLLTKHDTRIYMRYF